MPYLVMEPDGSRAIIRLLADRAALESYLAECSDASQEGVPDPTWLKEFPLDEYGHVHPGRWPEGSVLIVRLDEVVVPRPVTTRWAA